jgi:hypothetical protein
MGVLGRALGETCAGNSLSPHSLGVTGNDCFALVDGEVEILRCLVTSDVSRLIGLLDLACLEVCRSPPCSTFGWCDGGVLDLEGAGDGPVNGVDLPLN